MENIGKYSGHFFLRILEQKKLTLIPIKTFLKGIMK